MDKTYKNFTITWPYVKEFWGVLSRKNRPVLIYRARSLKALYKRIDQFYGDVR